MASQALVHTVGKSTSAVRLLTRPTLPMATTPVGGMGPLVRQLSSGPPRRRPPPSNRANSAAMVFPMLRQNQRKTIPVNTVVKFVPQQEAWVVERMGKFHRILDPGLAILLPFLDRIKYVQSLKEVAVEIPTQSAITQDNVTLELDGVLYYRVVDAYKASYGVEDAEFSIMQLAQTTMRAEIGQMALDTTLAERNLLNTNIVNAINHAAEEWGIRCLRYEIRDIHPPEKVVEAMHSQVSAERSKRAQILESEGFRQSEINVAEGKKQATILASEAVMVEQINQAKGAAEAILAHAGATAQGIERVAQAITRSEGGHEAVSLTVAEKYVNAFANLAKESTTVVVPADANNVSGMVAQALAVYKNINHASPSSTKPATSRLTGSSDQAQALLQQLGSTKSTEPKQ
ncbi:Stomatin [Dimargaris verticillata]|uniref:Stomatin n=1 Tax=Dimargaris verticillata TaxID=2761393 RepID=A0A9W8B8L2_9FUNG|nr:Stomatin [Dimargaris verticillata]